MVSKKIIRVVSLLLALLMAAGAVAVIFQVVANGADVNAVPETGRNSSVKVVYFAAGAALICAGCVIAGRKRKKPDESKGETYTEKNV
ncbi:MAG: LPXTG cell wall anchor domain-containing protein [Clostridiales bacterium]|nr:LPXTG cell wall anchor domain-containing protein [Clostridiales bacterium]